MAATGDYIHQTERLENGLRLCWLNMPHTHSTCLTALVRTGPAYENRDNNGVSHLIEHLHLSVTRHYQTRLDLRRAVDALAAYFDAETHPDVLQYTFTVAPSRLAEISELATEILEIRSFPAHIVEAEKALIRTEIASQSESPDQYMCRLLFGRHPYAMPMGGTRRSMKSLTIDQIESFDRASFSPERVVVAIAGRVLAEQMELVCGNLVRLRPACADTLVVPPAPKLQLPIFRRRRARSRHRNVLLGFFTGPWQGPEERVARALVLASLNAFSSPLHERVRYEQGSTYVFGADTYEVHGTRILYVFATTERRHRDSFIRSVLQELADIRDGRLSSDWLTTIRQQYGYMVERAKDSPEAVACRIGREEASDLEHRMTIEEELGLLDRVCTPDLAHAVQRFFAPANFFLLFDGSTRLFDAARVKRIVGRYV